MRSSRLASRPVHWDWASMKSPPLKWARWRVSQLAAIMGAEPPARQEKGRFMEPLDAIAAELGEALKARKETVAVAESSSGGLISAALLGVAGASAYYLGGAVVYTGKARMVLMDLPREAVAGMRSASEPYALLLARTARERFGATWGVSETGAAG